MIISFRRESERAAQHRGAGQNLSFLQMFCSDNLHGAAMTVLLNSYKIYIFDVCMTYRFIFMMYIFLVIWASFPATGNYTIRPSFLPSPAGQTQFYYSPGNRAFSRVLYCVCKRTERFRQDPSLTFLKGTLSEVRFDRSFYNTLIGTSKLDLPTN